jgi:ubiquinol-cytochrome c reductase cytochrome b subunit
MIFQKDTRANWINQRFPLKKLWNEHLANYYAPKNFNFWYFFGSLSLLVLVNQLVTGIWLTMYYTPTAEGAFASIQYIMRDVNFGWLLRYLHTTGASAFFIVIYCHMFRALLYGSHKKPRELIWVIGMVIYLTLLAEAFMGYLLPWGQMSYWAAQVILSLFSAIPLVGDQLVTWLRGDYTVSGVTLNRFFALHVAGLPLLLLALVWMHILALHQVGSNNPDGIEIHDHLDSRGKPVDGIPFHPYYTVKDIFGCAVFLLLFSIVVFYIPDMFGYFLEPINDLPADPLQTPPRISPVWYMTPYYAMLRAVPNKLSGVLVLWSAVGILFALPWLDKNPVKSLRYRGPVSKIALTIFVLSFLTLGYLGTEEVDPIRTNLARVCTMLYFSFFIFMPYYSKRDRFKPIPDRVTS